MIRHNRILVPTDFSEQSREAIRRAVVLAEKFDAEVHLLHVIEPSVYFETDMISIPPLNEVNEARHQGALNRLKEESEALDVDVVTHLEEFGGDPARNICQFAASLPADLIVIGRHGEKGAVAHMVMGSTAERIVAHASCSVLVTMPHDLLEDAQA